MIWLRKSFAALFLLVMMTSAGLVSHAHAQAGTVCRVAEDAGSNASFGRRQSLFLASSICLRQTSTRAAIDGSVGSAVLSIAIFSGGGTEIAIEHGDDISNVVAPAFTGTDPGVIVLGADTAAATAASVDTFIQFDYLGQTFRATVVKAAGSDRLNAYTLVAVSNTDQTLSAFLLNRANHILNSQPDLIGFVDVSRPPKTRPLLI